MSNWQLVILSARTKEALHRNIDNFARFFEEESNNLADAAYTLQIGRKPFQHRLSIVSNCLLDASAKLSSFEVKERVSVAKRESRPVNFMFTGPGSQYINMASEMYREVSLFQEFIHECFDQLPADLGEKVKETLYPEEHKEGLIQDSEVAPYITFTIEYALAKYLLKLGITPYAMIGDGIGEYVAACLSGVFSLKDALQLISAQGNLAEIKKIGLKTPRIPYISHNTGDWITVEEAMNPNYWTGQIQNRVKFSEGLTKLLEPEDAILIEIGGNELADIARQQEGCKKEQVFLRLLPSQEDKTPDHYYFLDKLGLLWSAGLNLNWEILHQEKRYRLPLPTYSFGQQKFVSDINLQAFQQGFAAGGSTGRPVLFERSGEIENYLAPRNEKEEKIIEIYQEVIGLNKISVNEDFFELGGDSLKAIQVVGELHKAFDVEVKVSEIFQFPTAAELAEHIGQFGESTYAPIPLVEKRGYYPVAAAQMRVFALNQFDLGSTVYNLPTAFIISGEVDPDRLQSAVDQVIERHESLRTSFHLINGVPMQKVHDQSEINFKITYQEQALTNRKQVNGLVQEFVKPFAFDKPPLMRVGVVKIGLENYLLLVDMHHIISDGTSMENLVRDLMIAYQGEELTPLRLQYKDFAVWQNELMDSERVQNQKKYWLDRFSGEIPTLELQTDDPRPAHQSFKGDRVYFAIDQAKTRKLKELSSQKEVTLFMVLLAAYNVLLAKYSGQTDIIIGVPTTGRNHPDLKEHIGMFINTLPMANSPESDKTFTQFLSEVKQNTFDAFENQDYQFDALVKDLNLRRDLSRNPVFNTMFIFQNMEEAKPIVQDLEFQPFEIEDHTSQFDVSLEVKESEQKIVCHFEYCVELFRQNKIQKMSEHFANILEEIIQNPNIKLGEIAVLSQRERDTLMYDFNDTEVEYQKDQMIHQLFEEQVEKAPENIALIFEDQQLTYKELNEKANQLARLLRNKGVKQDDLIGIMVERSVEMIIGILAILKSGGAYVPIDPEYPRERIHYILQDSNAKILIVKGTGKKEFHFDNILVDLETQPCDSNERSNLEKVSSSDNLAYIIYTSGSTGQPKGVMVKHNSIVNTLLWRRDCYQFDSNDATLQIPSISFDSSVEDIFTALISGAKLVLIKEEDKLNLSYLREKIEKHQITHFLMVPSLYKKVINEMDTDFRSLRCVTVAGEGFTEELVEEHFAKLKDVQLYNEYGPTENSVCTTVYKFDDCSKVLIGKPIANVKCYILDTQNNLLPTGVAGELCISGKGITCGYLNKPDVTEEKFVANPFGEGKMYRTGDLARWLPDGNIEFLGRMDHQVKIRGYRIELQEIERQIAKFAHVKSAIVLDREDSNKNKFLCAYIVGEEDLDQEELRAHLAEFLPDYMIPSYFIVLDALPLTPNGKIDRNALPKPEVRPEEDYLPPRTEIEKKLTAVWEEVLHIVPIGVNDDFFKIGGESLKAISIASRLTNQGFEMGVNDLFNYPTIRELAQVLENREKSSLIGEIDRLEEAISNEYNCKVKIIKYVTDKKLYHVYYLEESVFDQLSVLGEFIVEHAVEELYPNYLQPIGENPAGSFDKQEIEVTEEQFAQLFNLSGEIQESKTNDLLHHINQQNAGLNEAITSSRRIYQFPLSPVQKRHILSSKNRASGNVVKINRFLDKARFEKALLQLVNAEELLRAVFAKENGELVWNVHDLANEISIPVIDLSPYREEAKEELFKRIVKDQFRKEYNENEIFYRVFLLHWDVMTHYFAIPIDHAIFDRMSMRVIKDKLLYYYDHIGDESVALTGSNAAYSDYIQQIRVVPDSNRINEIITTYDLEHYNQYKAIVEELIMERETDVVEVRDVILPFDDHITPGKSWQISFYLFTKAVSEYFGISQVPIKLVNFGRRYQDKTYYNTVGEFLDFIPILVDAEERNPAKMAKSVQDKIKYAEKNILNFVNLIEVDKKIEQLIMPQTIEHLDIIFNYEDFMSAEENKLARLFMSQSDHVIAQGFQVSSIECAVFYDAEKLTISIVSPLANCVSSFEESMKRLASGILETV